MVADNRKQLEADELEHKWYQLDEWLRPAGNDDSFILNEVVNERLRAGAVDACVVELGTGEGVEVEHFGPERPDLLNEVLVIRLGSVGELAEVVAVECAGAAPRFAGQQVEGHLEVLVDVVKLVVAGVRHSDVVGYRLHTSRTHAPGQASVDRVKQTQTHHHENQKALTQLL